MIEATVFRDTYDNKTHRRISFDRWEQFERVLYTLSERETYKPEKGDRSGNGAELISPAVYGEGYTRANANVLRWGGWAALDVDDYEGDVETIFDSFGEHYYVCYSTGSSTRDKPKFRLVFPLRSSVSRDKIPHFWYALNRTYLDVGDAQTKDLSRMFYVPGRYPDAYNFIFTHEGPFIDPDELMARYPYVATTRGRSFLDRLPPDIAETIVETRKRAAVNSSVQWTNYRDCPFVNDNLVAQYKAITTTGWYHKMYQILVSIAGNAVRADYPITANEIAELARQIDNDTGGWYRRRDLKGEADRAIEYVYRNG